MVQRSLAALFNVAGSPTKTSRTFPSSEFLENGFSIISASIPAEGGPAEYSEYPDMSTPLVPGRTDFRRSSRTAPPILGMTTSLSAK